MIATLLAGAARAGPAGTDCHMHVQPSGLGGLPNDAARVQLALEGAGLARACVLSFGYKAPSDCTPPDCRSQREATQKANDWTLAEAAKSENLLGFCGVPIMAPWAGDEVARCAKAGARGLKLHSKGEGITLRDAGPAAAFGAVLDASAKAQLPVLIHIGAGAEEATAFFAIVASHPKATVIAAHFLAQDAALLPKAPKNLYVEVSGLVLAPKAAGAYFVKMWREMGMERVLLGSDWPLLHPSEHLAYLRAYPLTAKERDLIVRANALRLFPRAQNVELAKPK